MTIYSLPIDNTTTIKIWDLQETTAIVQLYSPAKRGRKTVCKIRDYKGRKYVRCHNRRYYLDKFKKVEI